MNRTWTSWFLFLVYLIFLFLLLLFIFLLYCLIFFFIRVVIISKLLSSLLLLSFSFSLFFFSLTFFLSKFNSLNLFSLKVQLNKYYNTYSITYPQSVFNRYKLPTSYSKRSQMIAMRCIISLYRSRYL